ncbi:myelin-oligodendrocyte glycoprotein-like isoform X2 [Channa argus]|uniref:myelin-oligodendrocyte glycoprotein-like isoform X2 n=1 Tax=Channa argus TaxID=215402 RepID=UPI00351FBF3C
MGNLGLTWVLSTLAVCISAAENTRESKVICSHGAVRAKVGQDVTLLCQLQPPSDATALTVEWTCNSTNVHVYRNMNDDPDSQNEKFKHRTSLFRHNMSRGNISLKLTNVTYSDAGNYTCFVVNLRKKATVTLAVDQYGPTTSMAPVDFHVPLAIGIGIGFAAGVLLSYFIRRGNKCISTPRQKRTQKAKHGGK